MFNLLTLLSMYDIVVILAEQDSRIFIDWFLHLSSYMQCLLIKHSQ